MDIERKGVKSRRRLYRMAGLVLLACGLCFAVLWVRGLEHRLPVVKEETLRIGTVTRGDMLRKVEGHGSLIPASVFRIAAVTGGCVGPITIEPGEPLSPGQVIVTLSNLEVESDAQLAEAQLRAAEAELTSLQAQLKADLIRQEAAVVKSGAQYRQDQLKARSEENLHREGLGSDLQSETASILAQQSKDLLELDRATATALQGQIESRLASQRAKVDEAQALLRLRKKRVEDLVVRSPADGVLQTLEVSTGQQIAPGALLAVVVRPDQLRARLKVPEVQAKDIAVHQSAVVDTRNGLAKGSVCRVDPSAVNGTVAVDIEFPDGLPEGARPDLSVTGAIEVERLRGVLCLDRPEFGQPESRVTLFRLSADGKRAEGSPVELGPVSDTQVEIRLGLHEGDRVVLNGVSAGDRFGAFEID